MKRKANPAQQDIINKVAQMAHYLNSVFKSVSFKMENFTKQIDAYRHNYHKRMPVSSKANRYNINDNNSRGNKKNNSNDFSKQPTLIDPLLNGGFHMKQPEEPKQSVKDLWQKFKQVQIQYLTRNYPFEKEQMFHKFALSKFNQMLPQSVKRYISQMQKLPKNSNNKLEQNDVDQYLQQISADEDQFVKSTSKKQKLKQKINQKQEMQRLQDNFFFVQQVDDLGIFLSNQPNSSNQQTGLKDAMK